MLQNIIDRSRAPLILATIQHNADNLFRFVQLRPEQISPLI